MFGYSKEMQIKSRRIKRDRKRVNHNRGSKTAKERGRITPEVYEKVLIRSSGCCELCGRGRSDIWDGWDLQAAHIIRRWNIGQEGTTETEVMMLCGPSTQSGTCHWWVDSRKEGKQVAQEWRRILMEEGLQQARSFAIKYLPVERV